MGLLLTPAHGPAAPSPWVCRWAHLVPAGAPVLDVACGTGRHLHWFHARNHPVAGVDRAQDAIENIAHLGEVVQADIEAGPWPFAGRTFGAVIVTHYLHRPLLPLLVESLAPGGVLLYETFAAGQETVGRPSNPAFLLRPGELLQLAAGLHTVAYEDGWLDGPLRRMQRIAAVRPSTSGPLAGNPALDPDSIDGGAPRFAGWPGDRPPATHR